MHGPDNKLSLENAVTEAGMEVNGREATPIQHDILTGSNADGTAAPDTCNNWTDGSNAFKARIGHHDKLGGPSWNSAHESRGCAYSDLLGSGGDGRFYCFASDEPPPAK